MMPEENAVAVYVDEIQSQLAGGQALEHGYRPALERLMRSFVDTQATNDPRKSEHGNPDMVFIKQSNKDITLGYAEAKDITVDLDKTLKTEQLRRYAGYQKLFLTNYLEFRFFRNGEQYEAVSIGKLENNKIVFDQSAFSRLSRELQAFLDQPPEKIKSGKRLSIIMGGKARRIRDNVQDYLKNQEDSDGKKELEKIYNMMKSLLVHDLTPEKFADMYAQTLVYGLFIARYNDKTPENFDRSEARDLVPKSNPFLQEFFNHIVGPRFDSRLAHIVDELCEVFSVSDVHSLIQKHLKLIEVGEDEKDPIIHFYEDFLKEYDPEVRKKMGAYYTPIPVVKFIVRQVDEILKKEFGIAKGLADNSKIIKEMDRGQKVHVRNPKTGKMEYTDKPKKEFHRVQVLDPAVGTATFLNETIKHIYKSFEGQEGRWPSYVEQDLLPRLHGFELMMAPYTIAHLKLGMTLQDTGVKDFKERLGVYLTNTLEEGVSQQNNLFMSFGLAEVVSFEAEQATKIKHENPIMVIIGNPPYSVSSNNKSEYIQNLIKDYKKDLNERNIQPLSDDYIKFIRFAEEMINKNGEGIMAMITNNSYIDGKIHRQMRKHLLGDFDKIYILNLHGSSKKSETAPDGSKDQNVFDIQQGVSILIAVKNSSGKINNRANVYFSELFGSRKDKFLKLNTGIEFTEVNYIEPDYKFSHTDTELFAKYEKGISIDELFNISGTGVKFRKDNLLVKNNFTKNNAEKMLQDIVELEDSALFTKYSFKETPDWQISQQRENFNDPSYEDVQITQYRPFDFRWTYYPYEKINKIIPRGDSRRQLMKHFIVKDNYGIAYTRRNRGLSEGYIFLTNKITDLHLLDSSSDSMIAAPLYLYHDDGTKTVNFNQDVLKKLTVNLKKSYEPEDILDYIYAVLHSPKYREKYKEFLKIDFPRVPAPKNDAEFTSLGKYGKQLRELHLMTSPELEKVDTTYPEPGSDEVEKLKYENEKLWINETQYFGNVPEIAWNFYIGGYQPAQKWLKDRKSRKLTNTDIEHYQKIIKILTETNKIMLRIDKGIDY